MSRLVVIGIVSAVLIGAFLINGSSPLKTVTAIDFVVEDNYRGPVSVALEQRNSEDTSQGVRSITVTSKEVTGRFPRGPYQWRSIRFASGKQLGRSGATRDRVGVLLWDEQIGSERVKWLFVGTEAQYLKWYRQSINSAGGM